MSKWYFTFGSGQKYEGKCQVVEAKSYGEARQKMFKVHGDKWCFQYSENDWNDIKEDSKGRYVLETELPTTL